MAGSKLWLVGFGKNGGLGKKARLVAGDGEEVSSPEMGWVRMGYGDSVGRPNGIRVLFF